MQREKFFFPVRFFADLGGMRHRSWKCLEVSLCDRRIRRRCFCAALFVFLLALGLPVMVMEFSVGRASQKKVSPNPFDVLEPKGSKWHFYKVVGIIGNYLLMMFYTTIGGWMLIYFIKTLKGDFEGQSVKQVGVIFEGITANPWLMIGAMVLVVALCLGVCSFGLQNGVEKVTKVMMVSLFAIMVVLAVHSVTMGNAGTGLEFYLYPRFDKLWENGLADAVFAAMGQAFFFYLEHRYGLACDFWQLYRQRTFLDRRGRQRNGAGYQRGPDCRPDYFSRLFRFSYQSGQRPESDFCHTAECV